MAQVCRIDNVIRHVPKDTEAIGPAEKVVYLDASTRTALEKPPLFTLLMDLRYYLVRNSTDPRHMAEGEISGYNLRSREYTLPVSVTYVVRCRAGHEARATLALFDPARSAVEILEHHITGWLSELGQNSIPEFVSAYLGDRQSLEAAIAAKALGETGLDLEIQLSIDCEKSLARTISVNKDHLRVMVNDFHEKEQDLGIRLTLDIDEANKRNAILSYRSHQSLEQLVPQEIARYFRQHVTMQTFSLELGSPQFRRQIIDHLNTFLVLYGRQVSTIWLESEPVDPNSFFQNTHEVTCTLHEYPKPVVIRCKVQMIRKAIAQYKAAKSPDLTAWLAEKLERYVRQYLFDAKYLDVLIDFERYEVKIKHALEEEAAVIGYHIEQLISGPDLEPIRWKEPFTIDIGSTPFETKLSRFYVNLQFAVTTRIPRLETVKQYLNRDQNVPRIMEESIVAVTRGLLHAIQPERFYTRFSYTRVKGETPIEQELISAIKKKLRTEFGAEVYDVVVKVAETELLTRLRTLMSTICPFVIEMKSLHGGETAVFRGNFRVQGVATDGWSRFQLLTVGIEDIRKLLEEHLFAKLSTVAPREIQFRSPRAHAKIEQAFTDLAVQFVHDQFGLVIDLTNVRRDPTPDEIAANEKVLSDVKRVLEIETAKRDEWATDQIHEAQERRTRLDALYQEWRRLATQSGTDDDIAEIQEKIRQEKEALARTDLPALSDIQKKVLPELPEEATLQDLMNVSRLGTGGERALQEGETPHAAAEQEALIEGDVE